MIGGRRLREVVVATFTYRHEAEFARGYLADDGLPSRVLYDDAGGMGEGLSLTGARLLVRDTDAVRARRVLEDAGVL